MSSNSAHQHSLDVPVALQADTTPVVVNPVVPPVVLTEQPPAVGVSQGDLDPAPVDEKKEPDGPVVEPPKVEQIQPVSILQLFRYTTRTEAILDYVGLFAAIAAGAAQPLMTFLFGRLTQDFVNFATTSGPISQAEAAARAAAAFKHAAALNASYLVYIGTLTAYYGVGMFVCTYIYMATWVYTGEANAKRIRERYFRAVLRQDVAYFDNVGAGEITTRIQGDTHLVQQGISEKVPLTVTYLSSFVAGYVVAYVRSWRLALAMTSILPCTIIATSIFGKFISKYAMVSLQYGAESGSLAEEVISTVRTAQAFGIQRVLADLYDAHVAKSRRVELQAGIWQGAYLSFWTFLMYSAYALAFNFGTTLINHGQSTAGDVVTVILAVLVGSLSLGLLAPEAQAIVQACGAAAKLYATIERVPSIDSASPEGQKPAQCAGEITFEHVDFNYPSRPDVPVLKNFSITFPVGKTSALVGASGSGKSTIIALIERFYDPLSGTVKLDGIDVKDLNIKWLRSQIGLVSQEPVLFSTTIKANVAHGLIGSPYENATEEEKLRLVKEACVMANADGFISKLPLGYDTVVGERGFLLSGGQKQRIAIARAIVSDPRILLLDEATSALDTQSEGVVQNALEKASHGRTTITIAHRLSTIRDADCIYVMSGGVIVESGTHEELLHKEGGEYARLVEAQQLRDGEEGGPFEAVDVDAFPQDAEKRATSLHREKTRQSISSGYETADKEAQVAKQHEPSMFWVIRRLLRINRDLWKQYILAVVAAIANGGAYPAMGIVFALGINGFSDLTSAQRRHDGDRNALWFFIIALGGMVVNAIQHTYFGHTAAMLSSRLRSLAFRVILRQDIEFFDKDENNTGQLTASLSGNAMKVQTMAGVTATVIVQSLSTLVIGFVLGLSFAWQLGLVGIACTPVMLSTGYVRLRVVVQKDQKNKKSHEESAQLACEAAGAVRTIASLTREEECCRIYQESLEAPYRRSKSAAVYSNLTYAITQVLSFWVIALVFWYGSLLVADGKRTTFEFFVGLMSTTFSAMQVGSVFAVIPDIASAKSAALDFLKLLEAHPDIDAESPEGKVPHDVQGRIQFESVHFRYPTRPDVPVLRGLDFTVEPGTYVALVGASGCGKSTTVQLIERFYDPLSGTIYLDNQPITDLNVAEYRKNIALVSQEPNLYAGTVRFNVLLGATKPHEEVTQEEIEAACRDANILDFIQSLPDGFDTEVGGKGSQLSGGQKQRIAIARALLRNPKVLLLDEATSALDSTSEKVVQEALDKAAKGRTTIAIAHRLSTIQNADRIYFIKDGVVAEAGTHEELVALRGGYYEYVQLQAHG
ncbi:P-loop containing nucleoside triphosphate hydrolase protein [Trametes polyzona]|nr:P-loop containing nucleoside triphosphate hydrolase protein [Trametes polyzona]